MLLIPPPPPYKLLILIICIDISYNLILFSFNSDKFGCFYAHCIHMCRVNIFHFNVTQTELDISPLMTIHQDLRLVSSFISWMSSTCCATDRTPQSPRLSFMLIAFVRIFAIEFSLCFLTMFFLVCLILRRAWHTWFCPAMLCDMHWWHWWKPWIQDIVFFWFL